MIIKLLPEQISKSWDLIRYGIMSVPSPIADMSAEGTRNILKHLLMGTVQCWAMFEKDELTEEEKITGFILTTIADDLISGSKFLNIYDLFLTSTPKQEEFENGLKALQEFAKVNKCNKITAYTKVSGIIKIVEKLGFNIDYRFVIKEL